MNKSIIEKLGIKPLDSVPTGPFKLPLYDLVEVEELEQQRNEMLDALILFMKDGFNCASFDECYGKKNSKYCRPEKAKNCRFIITANIIEKTCHPKSWEEIKELLK